MKPSKPGGLSIVRIGGVAYFLDIRLKQLRAVHSPHEFIDLEEELAGVETGDG